MVLLAICDAKYCFSLVDIGSYGRDNDAAIFNESELGKAFSRGAFHLPDAVQVNSDCSVPAVLNADDIFALKRWLMKPYPGKNLSLEERVFNYRLSRAQRTIENAFGIMSAKWRIYRHPINAKPSKVEDIIKATVCLHNYLRLMDGAHYLPTGFVDNESNSGIIIPGDWRREVTDQSCMVNLSKSRSNRPVFDANTLKNYFNSETSSLSWQLEYVQSCGHNPVSRK